MSSEPEATAEQYRQRAVLLADLGRYEEAAEELAAGMALEPDNVDLRVTVARVELAANRPAAALTATDAALSGGRRPLEVLVARGMALIDLQRYAEATQVAEELLQRGADDAYALRSGAAILGEAHNGQRALEAAWRAVQLAPDDASAHLVLGVITARLRLFDLAERAYREALRLDPLLAELDSDTGVVRLEQRRYAAALARIAEDSEFAVPVVEPVRPVVRPLDESVRRLTVYGAGFGLITAVIAAAMAGANDGASRAWAAFMAVVGLVVVGVLAARLPIAVGQAYRQVRAEDRLLGYAAPAACAAQLAVLSYAVIGGPWPLVLAVALSVGAGLASHYPR